MEFRILGPLEVLAGGETLALGSAQQRAVLALLLVCAPKSLTSDGLVDELWGERPPVTAQHAVQVHVSAIRKLWGVGDEAAVRTSPTGYRLEVDPERVDASRFERLLEQAPRALSDDPARARLLLTDALGLWRGLPLADLHDSELACREADRLEDLRALAVEGVGRSPVGLPGKHAEVIATITDLGAANPVRERPRRLLMLAQYRGCNRLSGL